MTQKNIAVLGKYGTENDLHFFHKVYDCIKSNQDVAKVMDIKRGVQDAYLGGDTALLDSILELVMDIVEDADAVVVSAYEGSDAHSKAVGWIIGYCYAMGMPVILVTGSNGFDKLPFIVSRSLHAHIKGLEELAGYDFEALPIKSFRGAVV